MKINRGLDWIKNLKLNTKFTIVIIVTTILPIAVLAGVLFYNMEQNVIDEHLSYMEYTTDRNLVQIEQNIDSINMSTQFFLADDRLKEVLIRGASGDSLNIGEIVEFYENDVADLERLVNNNPRLYSVRVFSVSNDIQELMPIFYRQERMEKLAWGNQKELEGWHFAYTDSIFSALIASQDSQIISLVTPVQDYEYGTVGYIESAMTMEHMFPSLYEEYEDEWSCFAKQDRTLYFGTNEQENSRELISQLDQEWEKLASKGEIQVGKDGIFYTKIDGTHMVVSYMTIEELGGTMIMVQDITDEIYEVYFLRNVFVAVMCVILLLLTFFVDYLVKRMLRQFYNILAAIRLVQKGDLDVRIENKDNSNDEMGELSNQLNTMLDRIQKLMQDNIDREVLVKNSEIRALQNQINAHFIYNVLESIKMMAEINEEYEISDAITSLGKLLRYSMKWVSGNVLLREELENIKNYMVLINLRFDYDIYLSTNIPEELLDQEIPKMSLQPIVENAILHGIEEMAEDTNIYIKGVVEGEDCRIEITDAGKGMTQSEIESLRSKISESIETTGGKGSGIGLKNVQDRITMSFGPKYGLDIESRLDCYTKVTMCLPLKNGRLSDKSKGEK